MLKVAACAGPSRTAGRCGSFLGRMAMYTAVRGEDGRGPRTALTAAVAGHFGTDTALDAALGFHLGTFADERIHELSPLLLRVATAGDAVALEYVDQQAHEIVEIGRAHV